jgi:hypothetical protein
LIVEQHELTPTRGSDQQRERQKKETKRLMDEKEKREEKKRKKRGGKKERRRGEEEGRVWWGEPALRMCERSGRGSDRRWATLQTGLVVGTVWALELYQGAWRTVNG